MHPEILYSTVIVPLFYVASSGEILWMISRFFAHWLELFGLFWAEYYNMCMCCHLIYSGRRTCGRTSRGNEMIYIFHFDTFLCILMCPSLPHSIFPSILRGVFTGGCGNRLLARPWHDLNTNYRYSINRNVGMACSLLSSTAKSNCVYQRLNHSTLLVGHFYFLFFNLI